MLAKTGSTAEQGRYGLTNACQIVGVISNTKLCSNNTHLKVEQWISLRTLQGAVTKV